MNEHVPQVFVGTMYCGEGDYDKCCRAILEQKGVSIQHKTIANQPEKEAHNRLWQSWRSVQHSGFDMFVKVDADTVLAHDEVLLGLWRMMRDDPKITGIQAPLLDYFTDGYIAGLNCFSPRVTFRDTADELFCDRQVDVDHERVVKGDGCPVQLRPAGYHCFGSTDAQAFHFGLHRQLKNQTLVINAVRSAWLRHKDRPRALALLGAQAVSVFSGSGFNYIDDRFQQAFVATLHRYDELVKELETTP